MKLNISIVNILLSLITCQAWILGKSYLNAWFNGEKLSIVPANPILKAFHLSEATLACLVGIKSSILPLDTYQCFSPQGRWPASYTTCEHPTVHAEWADIYFQAQGRVSVTLKDSTDSLEQGLHWGLHICTLEPGNRYALWQWKLNIYDNSTWINLETSLARIVL